MSAETISLLYKPVTYLFGIIGGLLVYIWRGHKTQVKEIENKLDTNYYSKEVIDLKFDSLTKAIEDNTSTNKEVTKSLQELSIAMAKYK